MEHASQPGSIGALGSCGLQRRFSIGARLARDLVRLEGWAAGEIASRRVRVAGLVLEWPGLNVVSGARAQPLVPELDPSAPAAVQSGHLQCPAVAVDLRVGVVAASDTPIEVWAWLGLRWKAMGNRWGGDFRDCANKLGEICLTEINHFDLGPILFTTQAILARQPAASFHRTQIR